MRAQQEISGALLRQKVGRVADVLVDEIDPDGRQAVARGPWDAPEIDGNVFLPATGLSAGDMVQVRINAASEYDLYATRMV